MKFGSTPQGQGQGQLVTSAPPSFGKPAPAPTSGVPTAASTSTSTAFGQPLGGKGMGGGLKTLQGYSFGSKPSPEGTVALVESVDVKKKVTSPAATFSLTEKTKPTPLPIAQTKTVSPVVQKSIPSNKKSVNKDSLTCATTPDEFKRIVGQFDDKVKCKNANSRHEDSDDEGLDDSIDQLVIGCKQTRRDVGVLLNEHHEVILH
jgi:hypothetical protein